MPRIYLLLVVVAFSNAFPTVEHNPEEAGFFQGDIRFPEVQNTRSGINGQYRRWPGGVVPITIDPEFTSSEAAVVRNALTEISSKTCIKFVTKTTEANSVFIDRAAPGSGCWSYIGMVGGGKPQNLNLEPNCIYKGTIAHELIHTLGFFHEQSRTDRDSYVTIHWDNIQNGYANAFNKYQPDYVNDQGVSYDYGSIMHYGTNFFAKDSRRPTMTAISGVRIGQRIALSDKDVQKIRNMYKC